MTTVSDDTDLMMFGMFEDSPTQIVGDQLSNMAFLFPDAIYGKRLREVEGPEIICASTIVGDEVGAKGNDMQLLSDLMGAAEHEEKVVLVKLFMDDGLNERYKGFIVNKGRPHNLVCVAQLDPTAGPLCEEFLQLFPSIQKANHERDQRYITYKEPPLLECGYDTSCMKSIFKNRNGRSLPLERSLFVEKVEPASTSLRPKRFMELCFDRGYVATCKGFRLSPLFDMTGPLLFYDLGVGPADFMFNTLFKWALDHPKRELFYDESEGWCVRRNRLD